MIIAEWSEAPSQSQRSFFDNHQEEYAERAELGWLWSYTKMSEI